MIIYCHTQVNNYENINAQLKDIKNKINIIQLYIPFYKSQ